MAMTEDQCERLIDALGEIAAELRDLKGPISDISEIVNDFKDHAENVCESLGDISDLLETRFGGKAPASPPAEGEKPNG